MPTALINDQMVDFFSGKTDSAVRTVYPDNTVDTGLIYIMRQTRFRQIFTFPFVSDKDRPLSTGISDEV